MTQYCFLDNIRRSRSGNRKKERALRKKELKIVGIPFMDVMKDRLDEELWTFKVLPEFGIQLTRENLPQLNNLMNQALEDPRFQIGQDKAQRETWQYPGEGAIRTVNYLEAKLDKLTAV